jgi:hypothetical protein
VPDSRPLALSSLRSSRRFAGSQKKGQGENAIARGICKAVALQGGIVANVANVANVADVLV